MVSKVKMYATFAFSEYRGLKLIVSFKDWELWHQETITIPGHDHWEEFQRLAKSGSIQVPGDASTPPWVRSRVWVGAGLGRGLATGEGWVDTSPESWIDPKSPQPEAALPRHFPGRPGSELLVPFPREFSYSCCRCCCWCYHYYCCCCCCYYCWWWLRFCCFDFSFDPMLRSCYLAHNSGTEKRSKQERNK